MGRIGRTIRHRQLHPSAQHGGQLGEVVAREVGRHEPGLLALVEPYQAFQQCRAQAKRTQRRVRFPGLPEAFRHVLPQPTKVADGRLNRRQNSVRARELSRPSNLPRCIQGRGGAGPGSRQPTFGERQPGRKA